MNLLEQIIGRRLTVARLLLLTALACVLGAIPLNSQAGSGRVIKVLPHFVDQEGRHTLAPSLFERDAYQAVLRAEPDKQAGMRFDVQWKTKGATASGLKLKLELRGIARGNFPKQLTLEQNVTRPKWFSRWTTFRLDKASFDQIGQVTAWRASLWEGDRMIGSQQSFLW